VFALFFSQCEAPTQAPQYACYSSPHFQVFYLESEYTTPEVITIAQRKERLLDYINKTLDVSFDGLIITYLYFGDYGTSWASARGVACESRDYVMYDDGHEIIHIVADKLLGLCGNRFIVEGFAEGFARDYDDPIARFFSFYNSNLKNTLPIATQITENIFDYSSFSYARAGAFIAYLNSVYGLDAVKKIYQAACPDSGKKLADDFSGIFNLTIQESEKQFYQKYSSRLPIYLTTNQKETEMQ
jgi:hypothetical protein